LPLLKSKNLCDAKRNVKVSFQDAGMTDQQQTKSENVRNHLRKMLQKMVDEAARRGEKKRRTANGAEPEEEDRGNGSIGDL
jgi:hypothetical protein